MNLAQAMKALAASGTEQNRKVYRRAGAKGEVFGVGFASLDAIANAIGTDHSLARKLWASGKPDARLLAVRIADAKRVERDELVKWASDLDWYVGADALAKLASDSRHAKDLALAWIDSKHEWIGRAGWHTLALLTRSKRLADSFFSPFIGRIEQSIHAAPNRTRDAMNAALIAIGIRSASFAELAIKAAKRIGTVQVKRPTPAGETPDAVTYIKRARAWLERASSAKKSASSAKKSAKKAAPKSRMPARKIAKAPSKKTAKKASTKPAKKAGGRKAAIAQRGARAR